MKSKLDPYIIIDAWSFEGISVVTESFERHGMHGVTLKIKGKGNIEVETSWGIEEFSNGDRVVIVDIASCIDVNRLENKIFNISPIEAIVKTFLHEISHWAEDVYRPDREPSRTWNPFLISIIRG